MHHDDEPLEQPPQVAHRASAQRGRPGGTVWAPRGVAYGFRFETDIVRMLALFLPAGDEHVFHRFSRPDPERHPAADPGRDSLPDFAELEAADAEAGVTYVGPPLAELLDS